MQPAFYQRAPNPLKKRWNLSSASPLSPSTKEASLDQASYYAQLEQGARHLASLAADEGERSEHLRWTKRYYRLRNDASDDESALAEAF